MVRGPRPTEYYCGELRVVPAPEAEALCRILEFNPPDRVVPGLSSGAHSAGGMSIPPAQRARALPVEQELEVGLFPLEPYTKSQNTHVSTGLISQGYWENSKWYFVNVIDVETGTVNK